MILNEKLRQELIALHLQLLNSGDLPTKMQLNQYYETFRTRFGPARLQNLDGEELLEVMHGHGNQESLVYWLEFKNDEEFPAIFGSIAGGTALKFGLYRSSKTGVWLTGSPQNQRELTLPEAVAMARTHREQLMAGLELLNKLPPNGSDTDYAHLQAQMDRRAPTVSRVAWGHKYFSLLYPDKLDDYHAEAYQRFHLIKLLQQPPAGDGRYRVAGRYVAIARELQMPLNHLTTLLNERNAHPHHYWRVLTNHHHSVWSSKWEEMRDGGYVALGWAELGNLADLQDRAALSAQIRTTYGASGPATSEIYNFAMRMTEGDIVVAFDHDDMFQLFARVPEVPDVFGFDDKMNVLGIGKITSSYLYEPTTPQIPHHRMVDWLWTGKKKLLELEAKDKYVGDIRNTLNQVTIEQWLQEPAPQPAPPERSQPNVPTVVAPNAPLRLQGLGGRIQSILERKRQVILYGPPGTGKTYWARRTARDLAAHAAYGKLFTELSALEKQRVEGGDGESGPLLRMCTFHPAFGYEDFLEGYLPQSDDGQLLFARRDGIFKQLCEDAANQPALRYFLIIDEINRGDVPRIFGELLTILERDKRSQSVILPLSGTSFTVPDNVYLIGSMNTADRSIALLDTALRRRFGFIELLPDSSVLGDAVVGRSIPLGPWLDALNQNIVKHVGRDARNLQIGHAYLLDGERPVTDFARFARIIQDDILPLLEEYCYEDFTALTNILGKRLVDHERQQVRHELFEPARTDDLIEALLAPFPDLATNFQVVATMAEQPDAPEGENEENGNGQADQLPSEEKAVG